MSELSQSETLAVLTRLGALLDDGGARPPLNRVAAEAVLGRPRRRGERLSGRVTRDCQRLQRRLSQYLGSNPPRTIREKSFDALADRMEGYRSGWGKALRNARAQAADRREWEDFNTLDRWFRVTTDDEFKLLNQGATAPGGYRFDLPPWVARELLGPSDTGRRTRGLVLDLLRAGISDKVAIEVVRRILSPFCGHARSGGKLLSWRDLTRPALRRALRASIEAERIWLGLTVPRLKGNTTMARGVTPLTERLPNPRRGQPGLFEMMRRQAGTA